MNGPLNLTFGVELEFVLSASYKDIHQPGRVIEDGSAAFGHEAFGLVARTLEDAGLAVKDPYKYDDSLDDAPSERVRTFDKWSLVNDGSIALEPPCGTYGLPQSEPWVPYNYAIEARSPALPANHESLTQIRTALTALKEKLHISVNPSCGLHVHIGNQRAGFSLPTLRNASLIFSTFRRQLNTLHPYDRIDNQYSRGLDCNKNLNAFTPLERASVISRINTDVNELSRFMSLGDRFCAYNYQNLMTPHIDTIFKLKTLEFRQHTATLDIEHIIAWIEVVSGLMHYAHFVDADDISALILRHADDDNFDVHQLFWLLRIRGHAARFYQEHGLLSEQQTLEEEEEWRKVKEVERRQERAEQVIMLHTYLDDNW